MNLAPLIPPQQMSLAPPPQMSLAPLIPPSQMSLHQTTTPISPQSPPPINAQFDANNNIATTFNIDTLPIYWTIPQIIDEKENIANFYRERNVRNVLDDSLNNIMVYPTNWRMIENTILYQYIPQTLNGRVLMSSQQLELSNFIRNCWRITVSHSRSGTNTNINYNVPTITETEISTYNEVLNNLETFYRNEFTTQNVLSDQANDQLILPPNWSVNNNEINSLYNLRYSELQLPRNQLEDLTQRIWLYTELLYTYLPVQNGGGIRNRHRYKNKKTINKKHKNKHRKTKKHYKNKKRRY